MDEFSVESFSDVEKVDSIEEIGEDPAELLRRLDTFFKEANDYRKCFESEWMECERYYDGKHWEGNAKRPLKNYIFSTVEYELPILTDSRPSAEVIPYESNEDSEEKKKMLSSSIEYIEDFVKMDIKTSMAMRSALITGNGYKYTDYDPDLSGGDGEITSRVLNWRNVWLDPIATEIDECRYVNIKWPASISDISRQHKVPQERIPRVSAQSLSQNNEYSGDGFDGTRWVPGFGMGDESNKYAGGDITVLDEWWLKDYSMEKIDPQETLAEIAKEAQEILNGVNPDIHKHEDHQAHIQAHEELRIVAAAEILAAEAFGVSPDQVTPEMIEEIQPMITPEVMQDLQSRSEEFAIIMLIIDDHIRMHEVMGEFNPDGMRPKYKNNLRLILKVHDLILYDGPHPVEEEAIVPLIPFYCYKKGDCIYAFGEVKNLLPMQKSLNDMDWAEYQGLMLVSNSGWIKDDNSNVDDNTLTNEPGIVVTKRAGTECTRLQPGEVSPQLAMRKSEDANSMQVISGITEATQGRRPASITAAQAIKYLQDQSIGRVRLKSRLLEEYSILREVLTFANRIIKYYSTEKKIRTYDKSTSKPVYMDYSPDAMKNFRFDLRIVPGSTVGMDKEAIFSLYSDLLMKGVIDAVTFFQVVDLPYKQKILDRLEQQDQLKLTLQQLQQENELLKLEMMKNTPEGRLKLAEAQAQQEQLMAEQGFQQEQPALA